jgi:hypothetical protein
VAFWNGFVTLSFQPLRGKPHEMNDLILQPILFMGALSLVMMLLMYMTRIPAAKVLEAEGVDLQKLSHPAQ